MTSGKQRMLCQTSRNEIVLLIPFASRSFEICLQQKKGDYVLKLNATLHHARSHHSGVGVLYTSNICGKTYKTKHEAQCHARRCKGRSTWEGKSVVCGVRNQGFKTQRGLSTNARPTLWNAMINERRLQKSRGPTKGTARCG